MAVTPERLPLAQVQVTPTTTQSQVQQSIPTRTRLSFGSVAPASIESEPAHLDTPTLPVVFSPRRSTRARAARKTYDANSGDDKVPQSVPEEI